jgi:hypothetical protein
MIDLNENGAINLLSSNAILTLYQLAHILPGVKFGFKGYSGIASARVHVSHLELLLNS